MTSQWHEGDQRVEPIQVRPVTAPTPTRRRQRSLNQSSGPTRPAETVRPVARGRDSDRDVTNDVPALPVVCDALPPTPKEKTRREPRTLAGPTPATPRTTQHQE